MLALMVWLKNMDDAPFEVSFDEMKISDFARRLHACPSLLLPASQQELARHSLLAGFAWEPTPCSSSSARRPGAAPAVSAANVVSRLSISAVTRIYAMAASS